VVVSELERIREEASFGGASGLFGSASEKGSACPSGFFETPAVGGVDNGPSLLGGTGGSPIPFSFTIWGMSGRLLLARRKDDSDLERMDEASSWSSSSLPS